VTAGGRVAEHVLRARRFGPKQRFRVDLHGVSVYPATGAHTLIRWEWVEHIGVDDGVVVRSANAEIRLPAGAFGLDPATLAERLTEAGALDRRVDVIAQLGHR
jgi:hypothetical protein